MANHVLKMSELGLKSILLLLFYKKILLKLGCLYVQWMPQTISKVKDDFEVFNQLKFFRVII